MRKINRFKIYEKIKFVNNDLPIKLLKNLKKFKWNNLKTNYNNFIISKISNNFIKYLPKRNFSNPINITIRQRNWGNLNLVKTKILIKKQIKEIYDNSFKYQIIKNKIKKLKNLNNLLILKKIIIKSEFRIDILLWRLCVVENVFIARHYINIGLIKVNNNNITNNYILKKGDFVQFNFLKSNFIEQSNKIIKIYNFNNFIIIDQYTKSLLILKNFDELSIEDISIYLKTYFRISKLIKLF